MTEPLRLSLGEGSFYEHFRNALMDGDGIKSSSNATLRKNGQELKLQENFETDTLSALGIDSSLLFDHIGNRIGQELAVKLQHIEDDNTFWNTIIDEWKVIVKEGSACGGNPTKSGLFCNLDESVISGILHERHGKKVSTTMRECTDSNNCSCFYEIICED